MFLDECSRGAGNNRLESRVRVRVSASLALGSTVKNLKITIRGLV
jgi:hypothetical protein